MDTQNPMGSVLSEESESNIALQDFPAEAAAESALEAAPAAEAVPKKRRRFSFLTRRVNAARAGWAIGPWITYLMVEYLDNNNPFTAHSALQVTLNLVWYYLIFWLFRTLLGRRLLSGGISAAVCFLFGLANHYVLSFRGRIIFPCDLLCLGTAANVAANYDYTPDRNVWIALALLGGYLLLLLLCRLVYPSKGRQKLSRKWLLSSWAGVLVFLYAFFLTPLLPTIGIYTQQWKTQANGFLLNFMTALRYSFVSAPKGYSAENAREIAAGYPSETADANPELPENLIVIMNESFADLAASFPTLELSDDPLAFCHSLTENTVKGMMVAPVTGGGTANVEFEFLTGDSLAFLPSSTVAYQLYLYDGIPSLVSQTKALGYRPIAFHPYLSSGWNRTSVYPWMGFDAQYYEEDVVDPQLIRKYVSDESDYQQLMRWTEETDGPAFLFNVTMQNHSGYAQGWNNLPRTVDVTGGANSSAVSAQYFSLMQQSDQAFQTLVEHYAKSSERTMIVLFGDHQPPLGKEFFASLYGKELDARSTEEVLQAYETPFLIWANYDIPEQEGLRISSNYLGVLTAQLAGFPLTGYQQLLAGLMKELPVATTVGFVTADGTVTDSEEALPEAVRTHYAQYREIAYNHLFDKGKHPDGFYEN